MAVHIRSPAAHIRCAVWSPLLSRCDGVGRRRHLTEIGKNDQRPKAGPRRSDNVILLECLP